MDNVVGELFLSLLVFSGVARVVDFAGQIIFDQTLKGLLSDYEEKMVIDLHSQLGNRLQNLLLFLHKLY